MTSLVTSNNQFQQKAARWLLTLSVFFSAVVTLLHWLEPTPRSIDLIAPPVNGCISLSLLWFLYRKPGRLQAIIWLFFSQTMLSIGLLVWFFILQAITSSNSTFIELLPPLVPFPTLAIAILFGFVGARQGMIAAVVSWLMIAFPILIYLAFHPDELFTNRGLDTALSLGPVMMSVSVLIPVYRGVEQQIESLKSEGARMKFLSERDPLTKLYNRRSVEDLFGRLLFEPDAKGGFILFDVDHFKGINDQYGHGVGDTVLSEIAQRCQMALRRDDLLARWGGEEFLAIIPEVEGDALSAIAESLRLTISREPIAPVGKVTASFGVTQFQAADSMRTLVHRADQAMYVAKCQGRDRVISR